MSLKVYIEDLIKSQCIEVKDTDKAEQLNTILALSLSPYSIRNRGDRAITKPESGSFGFAVGQTLPKLESDNFLGDFKEKQKNIFENQFQRRLIEAVKKIISSK